MDQFLRDADRNTIMLINIPSEKVALSFLESVKKLEKILNRKLKVLIVADKLKKSNHIDYSLPAEFKVILTNTSSVRQLEKSLKPYLDKLLAVVCRSEENIPYFKNIIPHIPYLETPSVTSLDWSTNKLMMRRRLRTFNPSISPKYTIVKDASKQSIEKITKKIDFPLIVKPTGLAASVLVTVCYHEEELEKVLKKSLKRLKSVYKEQSGRGVPAILVEEFMEGRMYSTDIYVNSRGTMYATPLVHILTAFAKGKDDFYGYKQTTPVTLKLHNQHAGFAVAKKAVAALALRSTTAHVELMYTDKGWKVVEVGPRIGGFRDTLYEMSYGIDHSLNDILIRLPMRPIIPRKPKGYSVAMKLYADDEGEISGITGLRKISKLESYQTHSQNKEKGDFTRHARHGGKSVVNVILFNKNRSKLMSDIRRIEQTVKIDVERKSRLIKPRIVSEVTEEIINDQTPIIRK